MVDLVVNTLHFEKEKPVAPLTFTNQWRFGNNKKDKNLLCKNEMSH